MRKRLANSLVSSGYSGRQSQITDSIAQASESSGMILIQDFHQPTFQKFRVIAFASTWGI